jgi:hypothetical protein
MARQLVKTRSELVFCSSSTTTTARQSNVADKQLTPESGDEATEIKWTGTRGGSCYWFIHVINSISKSLFTAD